MKPAHCRRKLIVWVGLAVLFLTRVPAFGEETEAERLIEAGHWKRARAMVEARLNQNPGDALANYLLSQIRGAFGERTTPLALAEKAVAQDGGTAKYHRQVAEVLGVEAEHAGAIQQLLLARRFRKEIDQAIALDGRDVQALRDLEEYYLLAPGIAGGDIRKAAATAQRIGDINKAEGLLAQARIAEFEKRTSEQKTLLRSAAGVWPRSYRAQIELARFCVSREHPDLETAAGAAQEALQMEPGRVEPYTFLAAIYAERGDDKALEALLAEAARQIPDDLAPYYQAADRLLNGAADPARAERYLRIYLGQEPEGNQPTLAEAHWKLGLALVAQGRQADAVAEWKQAQRLDPASPAGRELKQIHDSRACRGNPGMAGCG